MKTDKKIEEIIDKYIDHLGVGKIPNTEWSEDKKQMIEELNTEVQKQVEDGIRGFVKEYVNQLRISPRPENVAPLLRYMKTYLQSLDKGDTDENR